MYQLSFFFFFFSKKKKKKTLKWNSLLIIILNFKCIKVYFYIESYQREINYNK